VDQGPQSLFVYYGLLAINNFKKKRLHTQCWLGIADCDVFQIVENGLFQSDEEIYSMNNLLRGRIFIIHLFSLLLSDFCIWTWLIMVQNKFVVCTEKLVTPMFYMWAFACITKAYVKNYTCAGGTR
jgi:hypothetical protein